MTPSSRGYVPLPGSERTLLPNSRPAGSIDPSQTASLTVQVRPAGPVEALEKTVQDIYAKPVGEREYLSRSELAAKHGARPEDLDAVEAFAAEHHLLVSHRNQAERTLVLTGRLGDLLDAFHANVHLYSHANGGYRGRQGEILIPKQFEGVITGIFGFDTRPKHRRPYAMRSVGLSGPGGDNGVAATDFAKRYEFPTAQGGTALDGTGQCIAIIELGGGFSHSDLQVFFKEINRPLPTVTAVSVDHSHNRPSDPSGADGEVMLDIEVAGAVAPKARLAVYFAPNQGNGFFDAINAAVHDDQRKPSVVSISWGGPEDTIEQQQVDAFHQLFMEAAALGVTICVAAGDHGVADLDGGHWDGHIHVDHPACDDYVLACGGTQISAQGEDVVWNDGTPFSDSPDGGGWAGGGGISTVTPVPAYQQGVPLPKSLATGKLGRGVPDIAMSATNYFTRVQGREGPSGGTSAVAPLMASLVALLNQAGGKNVGFLNPFLYANASSGLFRDVTKGDNGIKSTVGGYPAGAGWDACTGLGTPRGAAILSALVPSSSATKEAAA
jgi:kumamolisin